MGEVLVVFKVFPKGVKVNLEELKKKIESLIKAEKIEEEEIAFGLRALIVSKVVPEEGGKVDEVENKLKSLEEVSEVNVIYVTRML